MTRIATLAAMAALVALPASAQTIRVATAGKTPAQLQKDIASAARQICRTELYGANTPVGVVESCVHMVVKNTLADPQNANIATLKPLKLAQK
jgi:hypothetical protein